MKQPRLTPNTTPCYISARGAGIRKSKAWGCRMRLIGIAIASLLVSSSVCAQSLPEKPQPRTVDREFVTEAGALAVAWTMDAVSTNARFHWCDQHYGTRLGHQPDCFEGGGFFNDTRDTAKIMGAWAATDIAAAVVAYEWKRHVRNRYVNPLWRVPMSIGIVGHTKSAIFNWRH
jgi:hypothetical protein